VSLDFGPGGFAGERRWLEINVRPGASEGLFTPLTPRQELTATPNALFAPGTVTTSGPGLLRMGDYQMAWGNEAFTFPDCVAVEVPVSFQQSFAEPPSVTVTPFFPSIVNQRNSAIKHGTLTATGFTGAFFQNSCEAMNSGFSWIAIGRWRVP
jgi:hypothetical protein